MFVFLRLIPAITALSLTGSVALAANDDEPRTPPKKAPPKRPAELIQKQAAPVISEAVAARATPDNTRIVVDLGKQRAQVFAGNELYIDTPISSGKLASPTPKGNFLITEKLNELRSGTYGHFVDKKGRIVRAGISMKLDAAPAGTHFEEVPMRFFCRLDGPLGLYSGILPGYPASHGSIRLPEEVAKRIFATVKVGTPVEIRGE